MGNSERYDIKNIDEAFGIVGDDTLKEVFYQCVKDFSLNPDFSGIYTSKKEVKNSIRERVFDALNDKFKDMKSSITQLRKHGFEVSVIDFRLLRIPLKEEILASDFSLENYSVVMQIFSSVEEEVSNLLVEMERMEKEKDALLEKDVDKKESKNQ